MRKSRFGCLAKYRAIATGTLFAAGCTVFPFLQSTQNDDSGIQENYAASVEFASRLVNENGEFVSPDNARGEQDFSYAYIGPGGNIVLEFPGPLSRKLVVSARSTGSPLEVEANLIKIPPYFDDVVEDFEYVRYPVGKCTIAEARAYSFNVDGALQQAGEEIYFFELRNNGPAALEIDYVED